MSSNKEFLMQFKLGAKMGSEFHSTVGAAGKKMNELQAEIRKLNQTQYDISAYQRQKDAIQKTKEQLELATKHYENYQREINATGSSSANLNNKLVDEKSKCDKLNKTLSEQSGQLEKLKGHLTDAGVNTENLSEETKKLKESLLKNREAMQQFRDNGTSAFEAVGAAVAAAGIAEGLKKIVEAYKECISLSSSFEETMSTVKALSGATESEMTTLAEKAKELGAATKFTANESAEAMSFMGMAGWNAKEMLNGMNGVLQLAAASGEDLAMTSDIVTDNLTAFGLKAKDTAHFSDVLATAATKSNTNVSIMGETFKNCASLAGALNYSVEDVAVAVGLMANAGIKGAKGGTALKNMFTALTDSVTLSSSAFGDVKYSAINADGTMKGFLTTLQELRTYFSQMTQAERLHNAELLVGKEAISGFMSLLNTTEEDYNSLKSSIDNCTGSAEKMAKIKLDNYAGQVTLLNSAVDALKITFGEAFQGELKNIVKIQTDIITGINEFLTKHPALTKGLIAIVAEVGLLVAAVGAYNAVKKAGNILSAVSTALNIKETASVLALNKALLANPYVIVAASVIGLTTAIAVLIDSTNTEAKEIRSLTSESREQYAQLQATQEEYRNASEIYGENSEKTRELAAEVKYLNEVYNANKQTVEEHSKEIAEKNQSWRDSLKSQRDAFQEIQNDSAYTTVLINKLAELSGQTNRTNSQTAEMEALVTSLNEKLPDLNLNLDEFLAGKSSGDWKENAINMAKAAAQTERRKVATDNLSKAYQTQYETEDKIIELSKKKEAAQTRLTKAEEEYNKVWVNNADGLGSIVQYFSVQSQEMRAAAKEYEAYCSEISDTEGTLSQAKQSVEEYVNALGGIRESILGSDEVTQGLNSTIISTFDSVKLLTEQYNEAYQTALTSVQGQYEIWDQASSVIAVSADQINSNLQSQVEYWNDYNSNLENLRNRTSDIEGLQAVIASFADGSQESVNAIAGMANASDEDLRKLVENYRILQAEENKVSESVADLRTNFTNEMNRLQAEFETAVKQMNLSESAKQSGINTIQGFINGANSMTGRVESAYRNIAEKAIAAVQNTLDEHSPSKIFEKIGIFTWKGYINGNKKMQDPVAASMEDNAGIAIKAVAENKKAEKYISYFKQNAVDQITSFLPLMVNYQNAQVPKSGENTPILNNSSNLRPISVNTTFNIQGDASENVKEQLSEYGGELSERVIRIIEDYFTENSRRAYL